MNMNYEEDEMFDVETIDIPLEDGTDMTCAILDEIEFEGNNYMFLAEIFEDDSLGEDVYCYRFHEDGDDVILDYIEDDEELARVDEYYASLMDEEEEEE